MESLVDITTTTFQAVVAVCVVFTAGYAYNSQRSAKLAESLASTAKQVLLPCLLFTAFASSPSLTAKRLLQQWPSVVLALLTHALSLGVGILFRKHGSTPDWIAESITINDVSSYPLLFISALYLLSDDDNGRGLHHLRWRVLDTPKNVLERSTIYILVTLLVTQVARSVLVFLARSALAPKSLEAVEYADDETDALLPADEEATERTLLVASAQPEKPRLGATVIRYVTPTTVAAILGLLVGLIKPLQRLIVGNVRDGEHLTGAWESVAFGLVLLGGAYAVVDMASQGAYIRAAEEKKSPEETVPPALGTVLILTAWRYVLIPIVVISVVVGFRNIPSTTAYLQDPAFSFVLVLTAVSPPALPALLDPFRSAVHFNTFYVAVITSVVFASAIAVTGRGVSYENDFDLVRALKSAAGGGVAGAAAMIVQVLTLMPMRTIMNYQYRYGGGIKDAVRKLWRDGGFRRYYAGLGAALFQGPLSRFGDTAANAGIMALLESVSWPVLIKTVFGSVAAASFRMVLTPIDTLKTTQQTRGAKEGMKLLKQRIRENGVGCLWWGALATAAATFVGNYPWFGTYNYLQDVLPQPHTVIQKLFRQAFIGFVASIASDTVSNSLRVVKTYRQVHERDVGYFTAAKEIIAEEGVLALFGRGLPTRLITNGLQGLLFSVLWRLFTDIISRHS